MQCSSWIAFRKASNKYLKYSYKIEQDLVILVTVVATGKYYTQNV